MPRRSTDAPRSTRSRQEASPPARQRRSKRADAERNIAAIVDAARRCLRDDPNASMTTIAREAGVGRVTLYSHFPSRPALLTALIERSVSELGDLLETDLPDTMPADQAFRELIRSSWEGIEAAGRLFAAAQESLEPEQLREPHAPALARIDALIRRGQREGVFRNDLPVDWLVTTAYALFHAAAADIDAGRLRANDAASVLEATLLPALSTG